MKTLKQIIPAFVMLLLCFSANAQSHKVSGVVSSTTGESLIGAGIVIKGSTEGTVTDVTGAYQLSVPDNATLVISCVGYKTVEYTPGPKTTLNVILEDDIDLIDEAVVVGYGTQSKLTLTGSVTSTAGTELTKNSAVNLSQGLAGRISGVIVNNRSGEPGSDDATILIRGKSTLGTSSPLIIIDGIQGRGDEFSRLSGDEIESINVLKDASAAIYGASSANGVIIVTTKRGKFKEAPSVTFNYDLGLQQPTRIVEMADAPLFARSYNAMRAITGGSKQYSDAQIEAFETGSDPTVYPNTNWCKEIIKPLSAQHKYGVSINGGSEKVAYFVQMNGQNQDGIYVNSATKFDQLNLRSNIDIKVTNRLKMSFDLNTRQQHKDYSAYGAGTNIFYVLLKSYPTGGPYYYDESIPGGKGYRSGDTNPAAIVTNDCGYDKSTINSTAATIKADYKLDYITEGLSLNGAVAYDRVGTFRKVWETPWTNYSYDQVAQTFSTQTSHYYPTPALTESQKNATRTTLNANLNYDRDFNGHHITGLLGFEQYSTHYDYFTTARTQYDSDALDQLFAGSANKDTWKNNGYAGETAKRSFFGRIGYDYMSRYMIQFILRRDGSENFAAENRWGWFPGVSVGWRLSEESFIKDNCPSLTNLKLRASYGEQGNDQIAQYQYMSTYDYSNSTVYQGKFDDKEYNNIVAGTIPNYNVTWEVARTANVGIDGNIKNGLLGWEVEAFYTRRSNILLPKNASIPDYTGMSGSLPDENFGIVSNKGVELQLYHDNRVGDFLYHVQGNFMWAKNTIIEMDETPWGEGHEYMNATGHPMGAQLIYQTIGINKDKTYLQKYTQMSGAGLGDFIYEDLDGNSVIDNYDRKRCDLTTTPQIVFGFNFNATWKNLDFSMLLQGQALACCYYSPYCDPVSSNVNAEAARNAWTLDNTNTDYPRLGSTVSNGGVRMVSFYYRNASFLRLKNIEIGYTIPQKVFGAGAPVKGLRLYIGGYNLLTLSGLKEIDPETGNNAGSSTYPQMRIFNAGVKLSF